MEVKENRMSLNERCKALLDDIGLTGPADKIVVTPLTGGVSSDIARVDLADRSVCVKFALPKLKVAADWFAPVNRNKAEYAWLDTAAKIRPEGSIALLGRSEDLSGFAMEFLDGDSIYLWKDRLLNGVIAPGEARAVGDLMGAVHAVSATQGFDRSPFDNTADFHALRTEPYLVHTAGIHPDLADRLGAMAHTIDAADRVLVHGDVSPKNIFFRDQSAIVLDAECATMGDASFDSAFCINHLVLKSVFRPADAGPILKGIGDYWSAYRSRIDWEDPVALEARTAALVPALMLARIDGKSPVEYLSEDQRALVRKLARGLIFQPPPNLDDLALKVATELKVHTRV